MEGRRLFSHGQRRSGRLRPGINDGFGESPMNILIILTSHDRLGETGRKTGFWLEELAAPYCVFKDAGAAVALASPNGGQPPLDPKSSDSSAETAATRRFVEDREAMDALAHSMRLGSVSEKDFDAVFFPGGHGPLWDLAEDRTSISLIEAFHAAGKPVAAVCHGPAVLRHARFGDRPLVLGRRVTGFTNTEEAAVGLTDVVPFSVEDMLKANGGLFERGPDWQPHAVQDQRLITGQNPASSQRVAELLIAQLKTPGE